MAEEKVQDSFEELEKQTQDEITQIMSELDQMQVAAEAKAPELDPEVTKKMEELASPPIAAAAEALVAASGSQDPQKVNEAVEQFTAQASVPVEKDIIKEIVNEAVTEEVDDLLREAEATANADSSMDEALGEMKQEEINSSPSLLDAAPQVQTSARGASKSSGSSDDGCLSMTLKGKMSLNLKYENEGQEVALSFESDALLVSLKDGTEIKVPLKVRPGLRAVA
jgi:hypothetical protein